MEACRNAKVVNVVSKFSFSEYPFKKPRNPIGFNYWFWNVRYDHFFLKSFKVFNFFFLKFDQIDQWNYK